MNKVLTACFAVLLLSAAHLTARAQDDPRPFHPLADSVEKAIKEQFPNWKRTSIPPLRPPGSAVKFPEDVTIDDWTSDDMALRVVIINNASKEEAKKGLREFIADGKPNESLQDTGNEAYGWRGGGAAFRKGRYTVYVSATPIPQVDEDGEPVAPATPRKEVKEGKIVAKIVARILKDLD